MKYHYKQMNSVVKDLSKDFPECGLCFGYIGNLEYGKDYRSWYIFTKVRKKYDRTFSYSISTSKDKEENLIFALDIDRFKVRLEEALAAAD